MENSQKQTPFTTSQIEQNKPAIKRSMNILTGNIANSLNAGHNKTIAFKQIMAGEKHGAFRIKANFQMLTPLTPSYQNLKMTIRTYFVPNIRVWNNAEKFASQKGGATEQKITQIPNISGKNYPSIIATDDNTQYTPIYNTASFRDSFVSSYLTRIGMAATWQSNATSPAMLAPDKAQEVSVLPLRGRVAIYNDMERNKEYDMERTEYKTDTVSNAEWNSYFPNKNDYDYYTMRAKRPNSYYTDYRTELQGFEPTIPNSDETPERYLLEWASFESKIAEARAQAENAQKNDWDVISEIRGSKKLTEGKVQLISERTFPLNYSAITQNAYNNNEEIREDFRVMGKQGAFSYTEIDLLLYTGIEFVEDGYIHVIATASADTVFATGIDRLELNINAEDVYRPDMLKDKMDVIYQKEKNTEYPSLNAQAGNTDSIDGFKRKYSEYFKMNNLIGGDMDNRPIYDYQYSEEPKEFNTNGQLYTNSTYQFFEESDRYITVNDARAVNKYILKKLWKDYSDLMVNKNQAIQNDILWSTDENTTTDNIWLKGHNQIFFVGMAECIADLPIDEEIKNNYTKWGEH